MSQYGPLLYYGPKKQDETKALVLLSGGVDSTVVLADAVERYGRLEVSAVTFSYGQNHGRQETLSAIAVANAYGVSHRLVDLGNVFGASALTGNGKVPVGHAEQPDATEVPGRNLVLLSTAAAIADGLGAGIVAFGANADDAAGYPDCRPEFIEALRGVIALGTKRHVWLYAPLLYKSKKQVIAYGRELDAPLDLTWSCYDPQERPVSEGGDQPCGVCGACESRSKAWS